MIVVQTAFVDRIHPPVIKIVPVRSFHHCDISSSRLAGVSGKFNRKMGFQFHIAPGINEKIIDQKFSPARNIIRLIHKWILSGFIALLNNIAAINKNFNPAESDTFSIFILDFHWIAKYITKKSLHNTVKAVF